MQSIQEIDDQIAALQAQRAVAVQARRLEVVKQVAAHGRALVELGKDVTVAVVGKTRKRYGQVYAGQDSGMKAIIGSREGVKFIRLLGTYNNKAVDITFKVGDTVEYDSYNLRYLGVITNITEKRVTVQPRYGARAKSMDLYSFAWRNYNFNLEAAVEENAVTSMYI